MATITLDYNARNSYATKALDYILSLGYFKPKAVAMYKPAVKSKNDVDFEQAFGAWQSDISAEEQIAEMRAARHFQKYYSHCKPNDINNRKHQTFQIF
jgi:hypothetical protein